MLAKSAHTIGVIITRPVFYGIIKTLINKLFDQTRRLAVQFFSFLRNDCTSCLPLRLLSNLLTLVERSFYLQLAVVLLFLVPVSFLCCFFVVDKYLLLFFETNVNAPTVNLETASKRIILLATGN